MTAPAEITVAWTDQTHEKPCQFLDTACTRVAVWAGTIPDMPCPHNRRLFCEPHKSFLEMLDRTRALHPWECRFCGALGWQNFHWERP